MNREQIIAMAVQANLIRQGDGWTEPYRWGLSEIEAFAQLVAAQERELCAQVCDEWNTAMTDKLAQWIRARK